MTKEEWQVYLNEIFPSEIMGFKRPLEPISRDLDFSTELPQVIQKDPVGYLLMNALLRQVLSNDSLLKQWTDQLFAQISKEDFKIATETVKGLMSPEMLKKLNGIATNANNYVHPGTHPATMITEDASHRFTTDGEKGTWNAKASTAIVSTTANGLCPQRNGSTASFLRGDGTWQTPPGTYAHPGTHPATMITEDASRRFVSDTEKGTWNGKAGTAVVTQSANGLMSAADKKKIDGIAANATAYMHPSSHPASMITEDSTRRFVNDGEKNKWNAAAEGGVIVIGDVMYRPYLAPGYVKANGATVNRADYPNLVAFINRYNLWTSNPGSNPQLYGTGNGSTTMVLPDYRNRVIWGGDIGTGVIAAGLPNITGTFQARAQAISTTLAFTASGTMYSDGNADDNRMDRVFSFDASKCNSIYGKSTTVQPPAIVLIPQIKY